MSFDNYMGRLSNCSGKAIYHRGPDGTNLVGHLSYNHEVDDVKVLFVDVNNVAVEYGIALGLTSGLKIKQTGIVLESDFPQEKVFRRRERSLVDL